MYCSLHIFLFLYIHLFAYDTILDTVFTFLLNRPGETTFKERKGGGKVKKKGHMEIQWNLYKADTL